MKKLGSGINIPDTQHWTLPLQNTLKSKKINIIAYGTSCERVVFYAVVRSGSDLLESSKSKVGSLWDPTIEQTS